MDICDLSFYVILLVACIILIITDFNGKILFKILQ